MVRRLWPLILLALATGGMWALHRLRMQTPARPPLAVGHHLHRERRDLVHQLTAALVRVVGQPAPQRDPVLAALLDWMEADPDLVELERSSFSVLRTAPTGCTPKRS
jgi:hypothetical protein